MTVVRTRDGARAAVQLRSSVVTNSGVAIIPSNASRTSSPATSTESLSLPPVLSAIDLLASLAARQPLAICESGPFPKPVPKHPGQLALSHPHDIWTSFDLVYAWVFSLCTLGNSYTLKLRDSDGKVEKLWPLANSEVKVNAPKTLGDEVTYTVGTGANRRKYAHSEIIHVRAIVEPGNVEGVSPLAYAGAAIRRGLSVDEYAARYFENDAAPGGVMSTAESLSPAQIDQFSAQWNSAHRGPGNSNKIAWLPGGWSFSKITADLEASQWADAMRLSTVNASQLFHVPAIFLGDDQAQTFSTVSEGMKQLLTLALGPWLARIQSALNADPDFGQGGEFQAVFKTSELVRGDFAANATAWHALVQVGAATVNEARAEVGLPPVEGGDVLQQTPVGGAPNTDAPAAPAA